MVLLVFNSDGKICSEFCTQRIERMKQQESSVGTTHINNGFQPGEKEERRKKKVP